MNKTLFKEIIVVSAIFLILSLILYFPIFSSKVPLNGNLLVSFWSPWKYLSWGNFSSNIPFKFIGVDEVREFYPLLDFTYDSLRNGSLPLWNPYNFSGYSHLGNLASAVFYPLHVSIFILSKIQTFIFLKISAIVLSGLFTYLYLKSINLSKYPSLFGSVAFAYSATLLVWGIEIWQSVHSFLWLPLALFAIEKIIQTRKILFVIPLSLSIAFSIMSGYIQPTIYLFLVSVSYALFRLFFFKNRFILSNTAKIIGAFFIGIGLSSVQLFPAIEAYSLSPRSLIQLKDLNISFLLSGIQVITLLIPDFFGHIATQNWFIARPGQYYENMIYVGLVPLIVAFFSFFFKNLRKHILFFITWIAISILLIFDFPTAKSIYELSVPFLSSAIPIRIVFILAFAISVLSAIGAEWWLKNNSIKAIIIGLFPILIGFLFIGGFIFVSFHSDLKINNYPDDWYITSFRNSMIPILFFIATASILLFGQIFSKRKRELIIILSALTFIHAFIFVQKYIAFSENIFLYPSHPLLAFLQKSQGNYRYWGYGAAGLYNNFATVYRINTVEGYDPVNIGYYNELLSSSRGDKYEGSFSRSDALLYAVTEFPFKDINDSRYRIMDILGVKYIGFEKGELFKIEQKRLDPSRYAKAWEKDNFIVFENRKVFPRVFLVNNFVLKTNKEESLKEIYAKKINLRNTVIVSESLSIEENNSAGSAKILSYTPNKVIVETKTKEPKILVLTDAFYPGWKAKVNDVETKIYRVNYALRGIVLPAGSNNVVFFYDPLSFKIGAITTVVIIIVLLSIIVLNKRKFYGTKT